MTLCRLRKPNSAILVDALGGKVLRRTTCELLQTVEVDLRQPRPRIETNRQRFVSDANVMREAIASAVLNHWDAGLG